MRTQYLSKRRRAAGSEDRPVNVVLIGGFGGGDVGNEASLVVAIRELRRVRPGCRIIVAGLNPEQVQADTGVRAVPIGRQQLAPLNRWLLPVKVLRRVPAEAGRWRRAVMLLRNADALVLPGTGALDDFSDTPFGFVFDVWVWVMVARAVGCPVALLAIGAGPIRQSSVRRLASFIARSAQHVSVRDDISKDFLATLGRDTTDDRVVPDLVFAYPRASPPADPPPTATSPSPPHPAASPPTVSTSAGISQVSTDEPLTVGLGCMAYGGWSGDLNGPQYERYLQLLTDIAADLLARGHRIQLLIGQPVDRTAATDLLARLDVLGIDRTEVREPTGRTFDDLLAAVSGVDIVVASRFHTIVAALMAQRPVVSLGYADKNRALLQAAGIEAADRHVQSATSRWVLLGVAALLDEPRNTTLTPAQLTDWAIQAQQAIAQMANALF